MTDPPTVPRTSESPQAASNRSHAGLKSMFHRSFWWPRSKNQDALSPSDLARQFLGQLAPQFGNSEAIDEFESAGICLAIRSDLWSIWYRTSNDLRAPHLPPTDAGDIRLFHIVFRRLFRALNATSGR